MIDPKCTCGTLCPIHDADSARLCGPQTDENASGVPEVGSGDSEPVHGPQRQETLRGRHGHPNAIHVAGYWQPLADGTCNHNRPVAFNLAVGFIAHTDAGIHNDRCNGWVLTPGETTQQKLPCERVGLHSRCAITGSWANHDSSLGDLPPTCRHCGRAVTPCEHRDTP